jgi:hypothetical protein
MRWSIEVSRLDAILSQSGASGRFIINTRTKGNAVSQERCVNRPEGSNWGDFGPCDQIGKMNLLTPEGRGVGSQGGARLRAQPAVRHPGGNALFQYRREPVFVHEKRGDGHNYNFRLSHVCSQFCDVVSDDALVWCSHVDAARARLLQNLSIQERPCPKIFEICE